MLLSPCLPEAIFSSTMSHFISLQVPFSITASLFHLHYSSGIIDTSFPVLAFESYSPYILEGYLHCWCREEIGEGVDFLLGVIEVPGIFKTSGCLFPIVRIPKSRQAFEPNCRKLFLFFSFFPPDTVGPLLRFCPIELKKLLEFGVRRQDHALECF